MRQGTYLNVILTVNAVLLAALIWTQVADRPVLLESAHAQFTGEGTLNAGAQRAQMIEVLRDIQRNADTTRRLLEGGNAKVTVTNLQELLATRDSDE